MRVTPLDIRKQEFRKTMRGLDSDEVYAFLNTVADEYEAVLSDNKNLRERIVELEERLNEYKNIEKNLRNTLLTAERLTAEAKENARREASLIIREAEMEAEKAAGAVRAQASELRKEILELKKQKDSYLTRLRTLIETHQKMIEGFAEDFENVDKEIERANSRVGETAGKLKETPRMSREKITENFAHETKDKVRWEEERNREDEERPSVPRPEWQQRKPSKDSSGEPADASSGSETQAKIPGMFASESQSNEPPRQSANEGHSAEKDDVTKQAPVEEVVTLKTEPIGAVNEIRPRNVAKVSDTPETDSFSPEDSSEEGRTRVGDIGSNYGASDSLSEEEKLKENIAKSIEENLYPEPEVESLGLGSSGGTPEANANFDEQRNEESSQSVEGSSVVNEVPGGGNDGVQSQVDASAQDPSDQWKQYDVRNEETDWKSYEIRADNNGIANVQGSDPNYPQEPGNAVSPGAGSSPARSAMRPEASVAEGASASAGMPASGPSSQTEPKGVNEPAARTKLQDRPDEHEVEEALSGLKEAAEDDGSSWSIEELKKNLTNLSRDEGDQG